MECYVLRDAKSLGKEKKELDSITEDKKRFIESGEGLIVSFPQCVECRFNQGGFSCEALSVKPAEFLSNEKKCPMHE